MKVLFLHPGDDPKSGPWASRQWDRVIDLGFAGSETYERWSGFFNCPVQGLPSVEFDDLRGIRQELFAGVGFVIDSHGLDWWELIAIRYHEALENIASLQKLSLQLDAKDEILITRECLDAKAIELLTGTQVQYFSCGHSQFRRIHSALSKFGPKQLLQIAGDKYDSAYRLRRLVSSSPKGRNRTVVLLPSAYLNATRTAIAYAKEIQDRDFLLVATRQNGWISNPPTNVRIERLASYAPSKGDSQEYELLLRRWRELQPKLMPEPGLSLLARLGGFDAFPSLLREGLAIREAWLGVFDSERISAVLCTDDSNPYTRIPLLIARQGGLHTIACHHGALDGRHWFKRPYSHTILAKGRMEKDYLVNVCSVPREKVTICAPPCAPKSSSTHARARSIVFFSEPYEVGRGRCKEHYTEVLPRLAELVLMAGTTLVIKLHPQESIRERRGFIERVLSQRQLQAVRIVDGPLREDLLAETWFAVTVISTTAVDCAVRGIPVFLCGWLEHSSYGYGEQFASFGVGVKLNSPAELSQIPSKLDEFEPADGTKILDPSAAQRAEEILFGAEFEQVAAV